jgi:uncharacterized protein YcaQ
MQFTFDDLRRFAVARNFSKPTTLKRALQKIGFVQADPIRAPARAQDLILRHRVRNYHAGDLERRYTSLGVEEDFFVNYGYVTRSLQELMHPRSDSRVPADDVGRPWPAAQRKRAELLLKFVRERGTVHPREVDEYFAHGKVKNYWGGSSNATTHLMDAMHYQGLLRVVRREKGIRIYAEREHQHVAVDATERLARIDALVDVIVNIYGPLPASSLASYLRGLRYAVPQWRSEITAGLQRAKERLSHARIITQSSYQGRDPTLARSGTSVEWYWPVNENAMSHSPPETVRFLAPFDPLVHDRWRFEMLWGWTYRLEAYTPAHKRKLGYYAMPLLWRDRVIGWGNFSVKNCELKSDFGYAKSQPRDRAFNRELALELDRMRDFLRLNQ